MTSKKMKSRKMIVIAMVLIVAMVIGGCTIRLDLDELKDSEDYLEDYLDNYLEDYMEEYNYGHDGYSYPEPSTAIGTPQTSYNFNMPVTDDSNENEREYAEYKGTVELDKIKIYYIDGINVQEYFLSDDLVLNLKDIMGSEGTNMTVDYYTDSNGRMIITGIDNTGNNATYTEAAFIGWADNGSIEVLDEENQKTTVFRLSEDVKALLTLIDPEEGDKLIFSYEIDQMGSRVIVDIESNEPESYVVDAIYKGRIDNSSIEVYLTEEETLVALRMNDVIIGEFEELNPQEDSTIYIKYITDENGSFVLTGISVSG